MPAPIKKSPPFRESESRQRALVEAAYAQIAEVGLEGLRTRDVAARVGINIATLHYYFSSKEELVLAVVGYVSETFRNMRLPVPEHGSIIEQIIRTAQHRKLIAPELHTVLSELGCRSARDPVVAEAMGQNQLEWRTWLEQEVRSEVARGILRPDLDPRAVAALLSSLVIGASMQLQMNASAFEFEPVMRHLESLLKPHTTAGARKKTASKKAR